MITTTFEKCRKAGACRQSYMKMARSLGGIGKHGRNTQTPVATVLDTLGLDDALWVLSNAAGPEGERICHIFACDVAERALSIWDRNYPSDDRPRKAIETKRKWIDGKATDGELDAARDAAWAAAWDAARDAAWDAAWAAAGAAAWAAWDAEQEWQINHLREMLAS